VAKRTQHVAPNNVAICCIALACLRSFGRGFTVVKFSGVREHDIVYSDIEKRKAKKVLKSILIFAFSDKVVGTFDVAHAMMMMKYSLKNYLVDHLRAILLINENEIFP